MESRRNRSPLKGALAALDQTERRLATHQATMRVLAEAETLRAATPGILEAICEGLGWEHGALWSVDRAAGILRCEDTWHLPTAPLTEFAAISRQMTFGPGI